MPPYSHKFSRGLAMTSIIINFQKAFSACTHYWIPLTEQGT